MPFSLRLRKVRLRPLGSNLDSGPGSLWKWSTMENPTIAEVSVLLAAVKALLRKAGRWDWWPSRQETNFLRALADSFGPQLPPEALTSRSVTLAYLRAAKDRLDSAFQRLIKEVQPPRTA